jgi:ABC-type transporter Mla maintaining outer membrane lipid asymmetry ATPase subunit MlaF
MSAERTVLEMQDVTIPSRALPVRPVLSGVNWRVLPGEYWIIGALPGSGKSDLLSTAAGLQKPLQGRHWLFEQEISNLREDELVRARLRAGLVFEHGGRLFQHLTVFENVALPLRYHANLYYTESAPEVNQILEWTGLASVANETPANMPRNLRQRVGLARALILRPEFLLLDNPLAGMDPRQSNWWLDFLAQLASGHPALTGRKTTLAIATDDLRPWTDQGNRFALLKEKSWREVGDHAALTAAEEPLIKELLAADFSVD